MILALVPDLIYLPLPLLHTEGITIGTAPLDAVLDIRNYPLHRKFADLSPYDALISPSHDPTYLQYLLYQTQRGLAYTIVTIPMLFYGIRITGQAIRSDPFTQQMVRRLRNLGLLVLIGGLLSEIAANVAGDVLLDISR